MEKLTKEAAEKYLITGGIDCPYCGGEDTVRAGRIDPESGVSDCRCSKCEMEWDEYWKMYGIGEYNSGDPIILPKKFTEYNLQVGEEEIEVLFHRIVYWWRGGYRTPVGEEEFIEERVKDCILDGCNEGELQYYDDKEVQHSGWWRIQK